MGMPLEGTIVIGGMLPPNAEVLMLKIIQTLCKDPDISNEYALFGCLNRIEVRQRSDVDSGFLRSADGDENSVDELAEAEERLKQAYYKMYGEDASKPAVIQ